MSALGLDPHTGGRQPRARWGLALRLARREVRRHPWRHALVTVLIMVPVLAAMAAFTAARLWEDTSTRERHYEQTGRLLTFHGGQPAGTGVETDTATGGASGGDTGDLTAASDPVTELRRLVAEAAGDRATVATAWQAADWLVTDDEQPNGAGPRLVGTRLYEAPEDSPWSGRWVADRGHLPRSDGEIFLTRDVAANGGWDVGDRVATGVTGRSFTVSGIGVAGDDIGELAAVVGNLPAEFWLSRPETVGDVALSPEPLASGARSVNDLGDQPISMQPAQSDQVIGVWVSADRADAVLEAVVPGAQDASDTSFEVMDPSISGFSHVEIHEATGAEQSTLLSVGIAVGTAGFAAIVAVVASAAFAIASRRQLKSVGLLATAGADPRTIRAALVLQGAIPGLIAGLLALTLAVTTVLVLNARDAAETSTRVHGATVALPAGRVALAVAIGVLAGMLAAWQPARAASRIPVLSALAGRRPLGPVPTRVPLTGLAVAGAGAAGLGIATRLAEDETVGASATLLVLVSVLAVVFGCIALAPTVVAVTGRLATRTPGLSRLGLRSIARHRTQAAATVAALAVCLAIPVGVLTGRAAANERNRQWNAQADDASTTVVSDLDAVDGDSGGSLSVLTHPEGLAVDLSGDLRSAESASMVARLQEVAGPLARIDVIGFSDGAGGWFTVAVIDPEAAQELLDPWAAQHLAAGGAVALSGAAGPLVLVDDLTAVTLDSAGDPEGGPASLGLGVEVDHLIPASVLTRVAVGRPPLSSVLVRSTPATRAEYDAITRIGSAWSGAGYRVPTLAELEAARLARPSEPAPGPEEESVIPVAGAGVISGYPQDVDGYDAEAGERSSRDQERRWLLALAAATGLVALVVLAITLSLRSVDSAEDHRAAIAAGAPPARMRRQAAFEGVVLALLGALLALPLGWIPVTAVLLGDSRDGWEGAGWWGFVSSRLHLPGWELVPILLLPAATAGVVWTAVPALRAALHRGPRDQVLPRA